MNEKGMSTLGKFKKYLNLKNYSQNSINIYLHYVAEFIISFKKSAIHLTVNDCKNYINSYKFTSISQQNQIYSSIKTYYRGILNIELDGKIFLERPRKQEKLPNIIPEEIIKQSLNTITNLKHKAILSLAYSIGLRRGDVQNIKIKDIDSKSMQIKIVNGKGNKDAYLPLYENVLNILRNYYKEYKPKLFLFDGQNGNVYSGTSLNKLVKKYIGQQYHFHNLRHSCATHLLNKGVDISYIQKLLRHKDIKTTMMYLKITTNDLKNLPQLI